MCGAGSDFTEHLEAGFPAHPVGERYYLAARPDQRFNRVVDIGAQSSELVIYYGDAMHLASAIPVCGDHFTRDLAQALHLSFDDAEIVKLHFGNAVSSEVPPLRRRAWVVVVGVAIVGSSRGNPGARGVPREESPSAR